MQFLIFTLLFALPIYFLSRWILNKFAIGTEKNRKKLLLFFSLILAPFFYGLSVIVIFFVVSYYPTKDFDQQEWTSDIEHRFKMSEDLIDSEILIGKTKEEVKEVLGTSVEADNANHLGYYLGFVPGLFAIDPDVLNVYFKNGIVVAVDQHES